MQPNLGPCTRQMHSRVRGCRKALKARSISRPDPGPCTQPGRCLGRVFPPVAERPSRIGCFAACPGAVYASRATRLGRHVSRHRKALKARSCQRPDPGLCTCGRISIAPTPNAILILALERALTVIDWTTAALGHLPCRPNVQSAGHR